MRRLTMPICLSLLVGLLLMVAVPAQGELLPYTLTPLGFLPGGNQSYARDINNHGQVVGYATNAQGQNRAFVWQDDVMRDLGTSSGQTYSAAFGINDSGVTVGISGGGVRWTPAGMIQELASSSEAWGINNGGDIAGRSTTLRASIWNEAGWMRDLGTLPGGRYSFARAINNNRWVVGMSTRDPDSFSYWAFVWDETKGIRRLSDSQYQDQVFDINDDGVAAGSVRRVGYDYAVLDYAVLFDAFSGQIIDIGGPSNSIAFGLNNHGYVVGTARGRAFLWQRDIGMVDLNARLDKPRMDWTLGSAWAVNDHGQIVGGGTNPDGRPEAFLLTPVPEPSSLLVFLGGLGVFGRMLRWRIK